MDEGRDATLEEARAISAYSGWGGAANAFAENPTGGWAEVSRDLKELLSEDEFADQRATVLTAFYTPRPVVELIWETLRDAGICDEGTAEILEPGCGTGNFMRCVPEGMDVHVTGVEIDPVSAGLARVLCPDHTIVAADIAKCEIPEGSFDAAIGNVPYSDAIKIDGVPLHDYMIKRAVAAVRPGGIVAVLTSRYTMDKAREATRESLARECDLVGMARLPKETFESQAGTSALCDLVILRKLAEAREITHDNAPDWVRTETNADGFRVNALLASNPSMAVGEQCSEMTAYGHGYALISGLDATGIADSARKSLANQAIGSISHTFEGMPDRSAAPEVAQVPTDPALYEFTLGDGGSIWYGNGDTVERFRLADREAENRAHAMLELRDAARALVSLEHDPKSTDAAIESGIKALSDRYDRFAERYGRLNDPKNRRVLTMKGYHDCSLGINLFSLEVLDTKKNFVRKADILSKRTVRPQAPLPDRSETPADALAVSYDRTGGVDLALIGRLLGCGVDEAEQRLGDLIVRDPITSRIESAEAYLSGDIGEKLDAIHSMQKKIESDRVDAGESSWLESVSIPPVRTPETSAEVARAVNVLMKSGLWDTCVHPLTADRAVIASAHVGSLPDSWRDRSFSTWTGEALIAALGELDEGVRISTERRNGYAAITNPLIAALVERSLGYLASKRDFATDGMNTEEVLWRLSSNPRVGPDVLAVALGRADADNTYQTPDPIKNLARAYGISVARKSEQEPLSSVLAAAMKADTVPAEFLISLGYRQAGEKAVMRTTHVDWMGDVDQPIPHEELVNSDDLAEYRARRERHMAAFGLTESDVERLAALRTCEEKLKAVLPRELGPGEIAATLGSPWIPPSFVMSFIEEELELTDGEMTAAKQRKFEVAHEPRTGKWRLTGNATELSLEVLTRYGISSYSPLKVISAVLNGSETKLNKTDPSTGKKIPDPQGTKAAWDRRRLISSAFEKWVWADPDRADVLCKIYNDRYNRLAPRTYDGSYLTFPGMNPDVEMRPHQRAAVARAGQADEGTLVAHVVGAGKTYTGIAMCMEARRLGRANKPLVVVPKHLTEQWASDFAYLYPGSRVLYMGKSESDSADAAREFFGRAANGDWDAVIVSGSRFDMLDLSQERKEVYLKRRRMEFLRAKKDAQENGGTFSVKKLEEEVKKINEKLSKLHSSPKTEGLSFEEIGFDYLFVDEAHNYKNLPTYGLAIAGMTSSKSNRSESLLEKCTYLREIGHGRNIVFATGTPVTNTMGELYNMQRYLAPELLERQGLSSFPSWAFTFGTIEDSMEIKPEGNGFQLKQRFTKFHNLPELMSAYRTFADIVTQETVNLKVPDCEEIHITVPATPEQLEEVKKLGIRGERVRAGNAEGNDNLLAITGDGMKVALDPKLMHPEFEPMEGGKCEVCAREVFKIWEETADMRGAQLVFCDRSTPASGKWNIQDDMRRRLIDAGIPSEQVACVSDAGNDPEKKETLFEKVRSGEVRVLMGSTEKLGTGTNVQTRLAAIHNLDCPWRPSDFEQRLGRIRRQGNLFESVRDFKYVAQGTFDSFLYSTVEHKQRFIGQVFSNKPSVRSMDDIDETRISYSDLAAVASGNPDIKRIQELRSEIMAQSMLKQSHDEMVANMRHQIESRYEPSAACNRRRFELLERDHDVLESANRQRELDKGADIVRVSVGGVSAQDRASAIGMIQGAAGDCPIGPVRAIGEFRGLEIVVKKEQTLLERDGTFRYDPFIGLRVKGAADAHWSNHMLPSATSGSHTVLQQMDGIIEKEAGGLDQARALMERSDKQLEDARRIVVEPWDGEENLEKLQGELAELEQKELKKGHDESGVDGDQDEDGPAIAESPVSVGGHDGGGTSPHERSWILNDSHSRPPKALAVWMLWSPLRLNENGDGMNVGKSLAESIEGATTAYYRDGGGTETGIAADERLVEALKQAYIAAYARNDGGSLDTVKNELAEFGGREPTTNEICEAAIALAGKQAKQDAGVISRMFKLQAASLAEEYAPALVRAFDAERAQKTARGIELDENAAVKRMNIRRS